MHFDSNRALAYARGIARPRQVGSGEDARVAGEIRARLEGFGYRVEAEGFTFWGCFLPVLRLQIGAAMALIIAALALQRISPGLSALPALGLLGLLILSGRGNRGLREAAVEIGKPGPAQRWVRWARALGRRYSTFNLSARLPNAGDRPDRPVLYLMAHYDSKSQAVSLAVRIALLVAAIAGSLLFLVALALSWAAPGWGAAAWATGAVVLAASLPLLWLDEGNASPGAIDDASGAGAVLHLAELAAADRDLVEHLDVRPIITSAEEWALMGSAAFVRAHAQELDRLAAGPGVHVLNFDGVGVEGGLYLVGGGGRGDLAGRLDRLAARSGLRLGRLPALGALFDHIPFAERGLDAVSLIAIGRASASIHTPRDAPEWLTADAFARVGGLAWAVMEDLGCHPASPPGPGSDVLTRP